MPTSHHLQINEIIDLIIFTNPQKLLDIGIGNGKYGFLAREYLEITGDQPYGTKTRRIDGIEVFPDYISPVHKEVYSNIYIGDAKEIVPTLNTEYDLILMIDVFEHFSYEDGMMLLKECLKKSKNVLISVPKGMTDQGEVFGNPYEAHKYQWTEKDFRNFENYFILDNIRSLIVYLGEMSDKIEHVAIPGRNLQLVMTSVINFFHLKPLLKKILRRS